MEPLLIRRGCALFLICCYLSGCKVSAPIHLWHPPVLSSTVGSKVVVSELVGDQALVQSIRNQLFEDVPNDPGRRVELVDYQTLKRGAAIQLAPSIKKSMTALLLARRLHTFSCGRGPSVGAAILRMQCRTAHDLVALTPLE